MTSSVSSIHLSFFMYWGVCHNVFYCGSSPTDILLHHFPSLLSSPLSKLVLAKIRAARDIGFGAHWHRGKSSSTTHEVSSLHPFFCQVQQNLWGGGGGILFSGTLGTLAKQCVPVCRGARQASCYRATLAEQCPLGLSDCAFFKHKSLQSRLSIISRL